MYSIRIKKSAVKELEKLPLKIILLLQEKIKALSLNPYPNGYKKLKGFKDLYRVRVGDYCVIYSIHHKFLIIEILKIGDRKDIYD